MKPGIRDLTTGICMILLIALAVPPASAGSPGQSWADNPEHIAVMQAYAAYSGELYKARMDGAVSYIGTLNGSAGPGGLQTDEQEFLATVASVPSMTTDSAVMQALGTMKTDIAKFRADLGTALTADNGSGTAIRTAVNNSVNLDQPAIQNLETAYWNSRERSRLDEFSYNDGRRTGVLTNLSSLGASVTLAQDIEAQIRMLESSLRSGFDARNETRLKEANSQLDALNEQFVKDIQGSSWQVRETKRLAQFDNTTARLQDRLTNLSSAGQDVSAAQDILNRIIALRPQLQTALRNQDTDALKNINYQLGSLDQQFNEAVRSIHTGLREQEMNRTPDGHRMNGTPGDRVLNRTWGNRGLNQTGPGRL